MFLYDDFNLLIRSFYGYIKDKLTETHISSLSCSLSGPERDDRASLLEEQLQQLPAGLQRVQRLQSAHPGCAPERSDLAE